MYKLAAPALVPILPMRMAFVVPIRFAAPAKGGTKKGKEEEKKKKPKVEEKPLTPEEEWKQMLTELKAIKTVKKDWGSLKDEIMSDDFPDWVWEMENLVPLPPDVKGGPGFAIKYNPNDPNELRIYLKKMRRRKIKQQNAMMKATKGIPQR